MNDGLGYIREAIAKFGTNAKVEVVRWEKDTRSGYFNRPFKVEIKADVALKNLQVPLAKRSRIWKFIRPVGMSMDGNINAPQANNRLNDPALIEQMQAQIDELKAKLEKADEEKPKRKKKAVEEISEVENETESTDLENA
jgi:hypothetical protein